MIQLLHGDCLELLPTIPDASVDTIITDPPYGIDFQSAWRIESRRKPKIANDKRPFIWWLYDAYRVLKDNSPLLCFCRWDVQEAFRLAIEWAGFTVRSHVIWDRRHHGLGDLTGQFAPQHDVLWFASKGRFTFPSKRPKSVLYSKRLSGDELVHPNEKPVDLMMQCIESMTRPGATVLDPFMGSGTTGVAALQTGRRFIGIERDLGYFNIASDRIAAAQQTPQQLLLAS